MRRGEGLTMLLSSLYLYFLLPEGWHFELLADFLVFSSVSVNGMLMLLTLDFSVLIIFYFSFCFSISKLFCFLWVFFYTSLTVIS